MCPRVSENAPQEFPEIFDICFFLRPHQNIAIYLDLSLQKTHAGGNLARQGAAFAATVAYCAQHDGRGNAAQIIILLVVSFAVIVCNRIFSGSLPSWITKSVEWNLRKLTVSEFLEAKGLLPLVPQSKCGLSQRNCSVFLICWRTTTLWCSSRHFSHWFRDELNKIQVPKWWKKAEPEKKWLESVIWLLN